MAFIPGKHDLLDRNKKKYTHYFYTVKSMSVTKYTGMESFDCHIKKMNLLCVHNLAVITWKSDSALHHYSFIHCRNKKISMSTFSEKNIPELPILQLITVKATLHKDTQRVWYASVKAISYFCKITTKSWLLKYVLLQKEENECNIFRVCMYMHIYRGLY